MFINIHLSKFQKLMKVSIGTVKSRLFRAKKYLKEMMMQDNAVREYVISVRAWPFRGYAFFCRVFD